MKFFKDARVVLNRLRGDWSRGSGTWALGIAVSLVFILLSLHFWHDPLKIENRK